MYRIVWSNRAVKALRKLPQDIQRRIGATVDALAQDPRPHTCKALGGPLAGHYGIRIGIHHRIVYTIDDDAREVRIDIVGSREGVY